MADARSDDERDCAMRLMRIRLWQQRWRPKPRPWLERVADWLGRMCSIAIRVFAFGVWVLVGFGLVAHILGGPL